MSDWLEVKDIDFGGLRGISSQEFNNAAGLDWAWDGLMDGAEVKLTLTNSSAEVKEIYIYTVSMADIPEGSQWSWNMDLELEPGEEKEVHYLVPMPGISAADFRDYTGPLRYVVTLRICESVQHERLFRWAKYYDIPAKVSADELGMERFNIEKALRELERTTVLHDLNLDGNPRDGINSIEAKLMNFGDKTQYVGIDTRAEKSQMGCQTQFFHEVGPKEEISVDIGSFIPTERFIGLGHLRIKAVSIPEQVFRLKRARSWLLGESHRETLIARFDFYFKEDE